MCMTKSVKELVQGDERDDDKFFLDTLFIANIEKADEWHAVVICNETRVRRSTGDTYREVSARVFSDWPQQAM